jgi:hypothetical protein
MKQRIPVSSLLTLFVIAGALPVMAQTATTPGPWQTERQNQNQADQQLYQDEKSGNTSGAAAEQQAIKNGRQQLNQTDKSLNQERPDPNRGEKRRTFRRQNRRADAAGGRHRRFEPRHDQ